MGKRRNAYDTFIEYESGEMRVEEEMAYNFAHALNNTIRDLIYYGDADDVTDITMEFPEEEFLLFITN